MTMEDILKIFITGVNRIRNINGLTQEHLADKIPGGKRGTISSWLRGRTRMPDHRMADFSKALKIPIEDILQIGREEQEKLDKETVQNQRYNRGIESENGVFKLNDPLEAEHLSIIRQFKNKDMACAINKKLVELEALDSTALAEIVVEIIKKIEAAREAKKRTSNGED